MKFQLKALAAAAILAASIPAQAAMDLGPTGNGSLVLTLLDRTGVVSAAFDLGKNYYDYNQVLAAGALGTAANTSFSWNLATDANYASAWSTYSNYTAGTLGNTLWGVVANDNLGTGAGLRGIIGTYASAGTSYTTTLLTTAIGNVDTLYAAANFDPSNLAGSNHGTVANGASVTTSGAGYAGSALFGAPIGPNKISGNGPFVLSALGSTVGVYQAVNGANGLAAVTPLIFNIGGSAATFSLSNTGILTYRVAAVPEADTWAMMMLGLGFMGFIARRKQV